MICCAHRGIIQYFAHGLLCADTAKIIQSLTFAQVSLSNSLMTKNAKMDSFKWRFLCFVPGE